MAYGGIGTASAKDVLGNKTNERKHSHETNKSTESDGTRPDRLACSLHPQASRSLELALAGHLPGTHPKAKGGHAKPHLTAAWQGLTVLSAALLVQTALC